MQNLNEPSGALITDPGRQWTLDEAFDYCAKVAETHYENFPVASFFLPHEKRQYIQVIYAFSRIADDFADEGRREAGERLSLLDHWGGMLEQCYSESATHPVFIALKETVKRNDIPIEPLRALLAAFRQDVVKNRYDSFEDLLGYCRNSADPVGRLVLMIFNYRDEKLFELSDKICTALQLANFWQDLSVDREKNRLYLPLDEMERFGYTVTDWEARRGGERFSSLMKHQVDRTRDLFYQGAELPAMLSRDLQLELKLIWFGGIWILKKIEKQGYDLWSRRPKLRKTDFMSILAKGMIYNDLRYYKKKKPKKEPWDLT